MLSRQSKLHQHSKLIIQKPFIKSFHSSIPINEPKSLHHPFKPQPTNQTSSNPTSNPEPLQPSSRDSFASPNRPQTPHLSSPPFVNHQSGKGRYPNQTFSNPSRDPRYLNPNQVTPQAYQNRQAPFPRQGAQWQPPRPNQPPPGYNFQNFQRPYQPQRIPSNGPPQAHFNQPHQFRPDPNVMYNQPLPQRAAFPGNWRAPPNPQMTGSRFPGSMNPSAFQPRRSASEPETDSNSTSANVLAARRKSATGSINSYNLDLNDVSGLHTIDQFIGNKPNQPTPSSKSPADQNTAPRTPYQSQWNQSQYQPPPHHYFQPPNSQYETPELSPQGYRRGHLSSAPSAFGQNPPSYRPPMRDGSGWSSNQAMQPGRGGMTANRQGGRGGGIGRGRGRGNGMGMSRGRGRGSLFSKIDEPSLPPPPQSILNKEGKFGEDLNPSGCPYGDVKLSADPMINKSLTTKAKKGNEVDLSQITNPQTILNELLNSSTPVQLPGFENPIRISPIKTDRIESNYSIESTSTLMDSKKRNEVVGRARKLISENVSMSLEKKKQAVGVIDFLLMSSQERLERVV
ncbi:hypothetical protein DFH28DRAFT_308649 [Melampsora americana]|nr:hypothetical protein DFH28DRAFT_308649 [Melampsora americana]